jgi:hypothetical protein
MIFWLAARSFYPRVGGLLFAVTAVAELCLG